MKFFSFSFHVCYPKFILLFRIISIWKLYETKDTAFHGVNASETTIICCQLKNWKEKWKKAIIKRQCLSLQKYFRSSHRLAASLSCSRRRKARNAFTLAFTTSYIAQNKTLHIRRLLTFPFSLFFFIPPLVFLDTQSCFIMFTCSTLSFDLREF